MVWAFSFPSVFGAFFPDGDFIDHRKALAAHYGAEERPGLTAKHEPDYVFTARRPSDASGEQFQRFSQYALFAAEKFYCEIGAERLNSRVLTPIEEHEWPKEFLYYRSYTRDVDILNLPSRVIAVTQRLRDLIEQLEPGVHQFRPIRVLLKRNVEHEVQHHVIVIGQYLSAFQLNQTDPDCVSVQDGGFVRIKFSPNDKKGFAKLAMAQSEFGNAHIWRERKLRAGEVYISDRLKTEAEQAGMVLPACMKLKVV
jgi:hypothetical protein